MQYFKGLRITPFEPKFVWVDSIKECADLINQPHEDYPERVVLTQTLIENLKDGSGSTRIIGLLDVQPFVFELMNGRLGFEGHFRKVNVKVGLHYPPYWQIIPKIMNQLRDHWSSDYGILTIDNLVDWYADFETIHPFADGNGRVGGVTVAVLSHLFEPEKGWMAPLQ